MSHHCPLRSLFNLRYSDYVPCAGTPTTEHAEPRRAVPVAARHVVVTHGVERPGSSSGTRFLSPRALVLLLGLRQVTRPSRPNTLLYRKTDERSHRIDVQRVNRSPTGAGDLSVETHGKISPIAEASAVRSPPRPAVHGVVRTCRGT